MTAEELDSQRRELLAILSATLWVLEHPEVNAIKFAGNPRGLATRIRARMDALGMSAVRPDVGSKPANAGNEGRARRSRERSRSIGLLCRCSRSALV